MTLKKFFHISRFLVVGIATTMGLETVMAMDSMLDNPTELTPQQRAVSRGMWFLQNSADWPGEKPQDIIWVIGQKLSSITGTIFFCPTAQELMAGANQNGEFEKYGLPFKTDFQLHQHNLVNFSFQGLKFSFMPYTIGDDGSSNNGIRSVDDLLEALCSVACLYMFDTPQPTNANAFKIIELHLDLNKLEIDPSKLIIPQEMMALKEGSNNIIIHPIELKDLKLEKKSNIIIDVTEESIEFPIQMAKFSILIYNNNG